MKRMIVIWMAIGVMTLSSCATTTEGSGFLAGNIGLGGLMAGDTNGNVYYRSESDHWTLYKAKINGTEKLRLSEDRVSNINVLGEWIYYTNFDDDFSVYKIKTDGTDRQRITEGYCSNLYVVDDKIYFDMRDENNIAHVYSMNLNGDKLNKIIPEASMAYYYNEVLYYIANDGLNLWQLDLMTNEHKKINEEYSAYVIVDETGIYYWSVNEGTFIHMNLDGDDEKVVITGGDYYNKSGNHIYYVKASGNYDMYEYDIVTETETRLSTFSSEVYDENGEVIEDLTSLSIDDFSFREGAGFVYLIEDEVFSRGTLLESLSMSGKVDCLMHFDGEGNAKYWD